MRSKAHAQVIQVAGLSWSAGAPRPMLFASEDRTVFAFEVEVPEFTHDAAVVVAEFDACLSVRFGFPNDEVLNGHPLWGHGLEFYSAHEVTGSSWLAEMRAVEGVHPMARRHPFPDHRHFMLLFHDSTLEALAKQVTVLGTHASMAQAVAWMTSGIQ